MFSDRRLIWSLTLRIPKDVRDRPDRHQAIARYVIHSIPYELLRSVREIVVEFPQVYTSDKSKGDPNDLLPLAAICGALGALLDVPYCAYLPAQWTAQIPKAETQKSRFDSPRATRICSRLDHRELIVYKKAQTHDEIDAIGLGLHHTGRSISKPRRVFPGAT